jgi:ribosome modulation factor
VVLLRRGDRDGARALVMGIVAGLVPRTSSTCPFDATGRAGFRLRRDGSAG